MTLQRAWGHNFIGFKSRNRRKTDLISCFNIERSILRESESLKQQYTEIRIT